MMGMMYYCSLISDGDDDDDDDDDDDGGDDDDDDDDDRPRCNAHCPFHIRYRYPLVHCSCLVYIYICYICVEYAALFVTCLSISMNAVTCSLFVTCWRMLLKAGTEVLAIFVIADLTTSTLWYCVVFGRLLLLSRIFCVFFLHVFFLQYNIPCRYSRAKGPSMTGIRTIRNSFQ